jgi:HSP20 family protein
MKKSLFERLTGSVRLEDEKTEDLEDTEENIDNNPAVENEGEGQLAVDVYQNNKEIVIKTMVAGVKPDDLDIAITRDMVVIKGHREESDMIEENDYYHRELYWGSFSRTVMLPQEIDIEASDAVEKQGLLTIRLPKIDKTRQNKIKVKAN